MQCDRCDRWELFENSGMVGEYDEEEMEKHEFVCRNCECDERQKVMDVMMNECKVFMCKQDMDHAKIVEIELKMNALFARLDKVEEIVSERDQSMIAVESECQRMNDKQTDQQSETDMIMSLLTEGLDEVEDRVVRLENRQVFVDDSLAELVAKNITDVHFVGTQVDEQRVENADKGFIPVWYGKQRAEAAKQVKAATAFKAPLKNQVASDAVQAGIVTMVVSSVLANSKQEEITTVRNVIVLGSSMARGVGNCLEHQDDRFQKLDFSGAKIEHIRQKLRVVGDRPDTHLVLMVGTNNLQSDGANVILNKYEDLFMECKKFKYGKVSIVGILHREDTNEFTEGKRRYVNKKLKELCKVNEVSYLDVKVGKWMLDQGGLHLNGRGKHHVAKAIFDHTSHLN